MDASLTPPPPAGCGPTHIMIIYLYKMLDILRDIRIMDGELRR
jgi:hypothetical protein